MPCTWTIPDPLCCDEWDTYSTEIQDAAREYATVVLWAATGRRFGLCPITVRPCGYNRCADGGLDWWGYEWAGATWTPYIWNGTWYNCACPGVCSCDPRCQVQLPGPVNSITEVLIDGVAVDPLTYRVDDFSWLVKNDPDKNGCWPDCPDMDVASGDPGSFEVTYVRGEPVPASLLTAAATLACEWAKACTGGDCRLSTRVQSIARQGIQITMVPPDQFLEMGLTNIPEVDAIIRAWNPDGLKYRLAVISPDIKIPRVTTS